MNRISVEIALLFSAVILSATLSPIVTAQERALQWSTPAFPFNEGSSEGLNSLGRDNEGNIVSLGYSADGIRGSSLALSKLRPDGTVIWTKLHTLEETHWSPDDVKVNDEGRIFVLVRAGYNSDVQAMLLSFSADGELDWKKLLQEGLYPYGKLHVDSLGIVVAMTDWYSEEESRVFRYSSDGNLLWERIIEIGQLSGYRVDKFLNVNIVGFGWIDSYEYRRVVATSISPEGDVRWSHTEDYTDYTSVRSAGNDDGRMWYSVEHDVVALDSDGQGMWRYASDQSSRVEGMMATDSGELILMQADWFPLTRLDTNGHEIAEFDDVYSGCNNGGFRGGYILRTCSRELGIYSLDLELITRVPEIGQPRPSTQLALLRTESGGIVLGQSIETEANDTDVRLISFDANGTEEWRVLFSGENTGGIHDYYRIGAVDELGNSIFVATEYVGSRREYRLAKINSYGAVDLVADAPLFRPLYITTDLHVDSEGFTVSGHFEDWDSTGSINQWIIARFDEQAREKWRYIADGGWIPDLLGASGIPTHAVISKSDTSSIVRLDRDGTELWLGTIPIRPHSYDLGPDGSVFVAGEDEYGSQSLFMIDPSGDVEQISIDQAVPPFDSDNVIRSADGGFYLLESQIGGGPAALLRLYRLNKDGDISWSREVAGGILAEGPSNSIVIFKLVDYTTFVVSQFDRTGESLWTRTFDSDGASLWTLKSSGHDYSFTGRTGILKIDASGNIDLSTKYDVSVFPTGSSVNPKFHSTLPTGETVVGFTVSGIGYSYAVVHKYAGDPTTLTSTSARLESSYPNPFSRSTSIVYDVRETANVRLLVYDIVGRHVTTLVDRVQPSGRHSAAFSADDRLASGVYVAVLTVQGQVMSKTLTLVR